MPLMELSLLKCSGGRFPIVDNANSSGSCVMFTVNSLCDMMLFRVLPPLKILHKMVSFPEQSTPMGAAFWTFSQLTVVIIVSYCFPLSIPIKFKSISIIILVFCYFKNTFIYVLTTYLILLIDFKEFSL